MLSGKAGGLLNLRLD